MHNLMKWHKMCCSYPNAHLVRISQDFRHFCLYINFTALQMYSRTLSAVMFHSDVSLCIPNYGTHVNSKIQTIKIVILSPSIAKISSI